MEARSIAGTTVTSENISIGEQLFCSTTHIARNEECFCNTTTTQTIVGEFHLQTSREIVINEQIYYDMHLFIYSTVFDLAVAV